MKKPDMIKIVYFLRGIGIGVIVTIIILSIHKAGEPVSDINKTMSKEEIIEKAKEYGLVEPMDKKLDEIFATTSPTNSPQKESPKDSSKSDRNS